LALNWTIEMTTTSFGSGLAEIVDAWAVKPVDMAAANRPQVSILFIRSDFARTAHPRKD
jgi:hypothetical protein